MTHVRQGRSTHNRRRVHPAVGTAAAAMVALATVGLGARFIGVTPPASQTSPYCAESYQCIQPYTDRGLPHGLDPLVPSAPAMWNPATPSGPHTAGAV